MSTDDHVALARAEGPAPVARRPDESVFSPWTQLDKMLDFGRHLLATGFCPNGVRTPAQVVAIIQAGREVGIPPMYALREIAVVNGRPTLSGKLMLALMHRAGVKTEWLETGDTKAVLRATRPNGVTFTGSFTIEEAGRAGLLTKAGNTWKQYPAAMLRWRTVSLVTKTNPPGAAKALSCPLTRTMKWKPAMGGGRSPSRGVSIAASATRVPTLFTYSVMSTRWPARRSFLFW